MKTGLRGLSLALAVAFLSSVPAVADIKSFNAAMKDRDYARATAAAASAWQTLDKSRDDVGIIAREFSFAAYLAGDYAAAKSYGEAALSAGATLGEKPVLRAASDVLLRVAEFKLTPSGQTRDWLYASLDARAAMEGIDLIAYMAADAMTAYDFDRGAWKEAEASAALGARLSSAGGPGFLIYSYRFELFENVAAYMRARDVKPFERLTALKEKIVTTINAAASDEAAAPFAKFYWEVHAWQNSTGSHLVARRKMKWPEDDEASPVRKADDRAVRMLAFRTEDDACHSVIDMRRDIQYPKSALYKGLIGTVILRVDIDEQGAAANPEILTSVPAKYFGEAVLKGVKDIRYKPGDKWSAGCSLVQPQRVVTFQFTIG